MEKDIENFFERKKEKTTAPKITKKNLKTMRSSWKSFWKWKNVFLGLLGIVFLGLLFSTFFLYWQYRKVTANQEVASKQEIQKIVKEIKKFANLPEEEPTIATVSDKNKLANQPFFKNAENGDVVLIFAKTGKAILYRPSIKKVIEMTLLGGSSLNSLEQENLASNELTESKKQSSLVQGIAEEVKPAKVAVYNGTSANGIAEKISQEIASISGVTVVSKANSVKNYEVTVVVDLTGENGAMAEEISRKLGGVIRELPEGEKKPDADILVIGGGQ